MGVISFAQRLRQINKGLLQAQAVNENKNLMIELNQEQLLSGIDSKGEKLGERNPYRWQWYSDLKQRMNPRPGPGNPDLKLTGSFHEAMQVTFDGKQLDLTSFDGKTQDLVSKYGGEIFGFTPVSLQKVKEECTKMFVSLYKQAMR